jgi:hypothetical protein
MRLPDKALVAVEYEGTLSELEAILVENGVQNYVAFSAIFPRESSELNAAKIVIFERISKSGE